MPYRSPIWDDDSKRSVSEGLERQEKLRALNWHDTIVLMKELSFAGRTYAAGSRLTLETEFEISRPTMKFTDEQHRSALIDGWSLARYGEYTVIPAPNDEPF